MAQALNDGGFHAFVLQYRVSPNRHPAPLLDASRAVRLVRSRAEEWGVRTDKVALLGFSAGGHLAGSLSVLHDRFEFTAEDDLAWSSQWARLPFLLARFLLVERSECPLDG